MARWQEHDIPDLSGKTALVTGANSGLGLETARALAAHGAHVVLACRGADKAEQALTRIGHQLANARLSFLPLDLSDLSSVRASASAFRAEHGRLDILCNNAGVMALPYGKTPDGFEMQFGINHLGHFALTGLLFDLLRATPQARVVTVSSLAHRSGKLRLDDPHWERSRYSRSLAYGRSKLANLMFALELNRRVRAAGIELTSIAAHPGYSATNIGFGGLGRNSLLGRLVALGNQLLAQPADLGALPSLYAATAAEVEGGDYIGPGGPIEFRGYPVKVKPARHALDTTEAARLWALSEQLTGVHFP
jgi:NAD(P)-dependent dehydrogenase (short-subunit alcohol dehydrogenase family)